LPPPCAACALGRPGAARAAATSPTAARCYRRVPGAVISRRSPALFGPNRLPPRPEDAGAVRPYGRSSPARSRRGCPSSCSTASAAPMPCTHEKRFLDDEFRHRSSYQLPHGRVAGARGCWECDPPQRVPGPSTQPRPKDVEVYDDNNTADIVMKHGQRESAEVVAWTDKCIAEFGLRAQTQQEELEKQNAPQPPIGRMSEAQRQAVFDQGLLNDVGTCRWLKGRALEAMGQKAEAKAAYDAATKLTYARTWDEGGWFWSPAQAASDRLRGVVSTQP
jgi:hypothetical protein